METLEIIFWIIIIALMLVGIFVTIYFNKRKKKKIKGHKTRNISEKITTAIMGNGPLQKIRNESIILDEAESGLQINFDPDLQNEVYCNDSEYKCRVNFFSKKGTVAVYKIWQHIGGEGLTKMKILDGDTKQVIDGGWSETSVFSLKENELRGIFLIFQRKEFTFASDNVDHVGVKIETSEGTVSREFHIKWAKYII